MNHRSGRMKRLVVTLAAGAMGAALLPITPASAAVDSTAFCVNVPADNPFSDVQASDVHFENILCLRALDITVGLTATTYGPGQGTSRAQMASFIARFMDKANDLEITDLEELPATGPDAFADDNGNTHEASINRLAAAGVVEGDTSGNYNPDALVNRSQMASYIVRAIEFLTGADLPAGSDAFPDDNGSIHEANINALAALDVVEGKTDGTYAPGDQVNRSQMASYLIRALSVLHADGDIKPVPAPAGAGPITLTSQSVQQGGNVTGTVANPTQVASISVTGCGIATQNVGVGGGGAFSFALPPSQGPGTCTLTFTVNETDGDSVTQTFQITVTAVAPAVTGAPDLINVALSAATNQLIYTFDEDVTGQTATFFDGFSAYAANGFGLPGISAVIQPDGRNVVVTFPLPPGTQISEFAVLGAVDRNAVEDAGARGNYASSFAVGSTIANRTTGPDLVAVNNIRTDAQGRQLADFVFDERVNPTAIAFDPTNFALVPANPQPLIGPAGALNVDINGAITVVQDGDISGAETTLGIDGLIDVSANGTTLTLHFGYTDNDILTPGGPWAELNLSQIRRGVVDSNAVASADPVPFPNTFAAADVNGGITDTPDLVSVVIAGPNEVEFNFDEPIDAGFIDADAFIGIDSFGTETASQSAVRSATDTKKVTVRWAANIVEGFVRVGVLDGQTTDDPGHPSTAGTACPIIGFTGPATVCGTTGPNALPNIADTMALQPTTSGKTALPDLVEITRTKFPTGDFLVTYRFDAPLVGYAFDPNDFTLVDADGDVTASTGGVVVGSTVLISTNTANVGPGITQGFSIGVVTDAVVGAVDEIQPGPNFSFTEGSDQLAPLS